MIISTRSTNLALLSQMTSATRSTEEGSSVQTDSHNTSGTGETKPSDTKVQEKLTLSELQQVTELKQRDREVRSHEAAHIAAGGSAVSGAASFTYQKGPDGKLYAIGGEVSISISRGSTPEETIAIAKQIQAGALAPANPSPQDLKVASSAAMMEARAQQELMKENSDVLKEKAFASYQDNQNTDITKA